MTQEEKELLLRDISARLPYGVLCYINGDDTNTPRKLSRIEVDELDGILLDFWTYREDYPSIQVYLSEVKPYLRPMSSMTDEEKNKINTLLDIIESLSNVTDETGRIIDCSSDCIELIDFYNSRYLDYRGLIPMGLAIEAPENLYKKFSNKIL